MLHGTRVANAHGRRDLPAGRAEGVAGVASSAPGGVPGRSPAVRRRACSYKSRGPANGVRFAPHRVRARRRDRRLGPPLDPGGLMASSFRRFVGRVAVGALAVAVPVVMTPVAASAAAPTDLFFSEYVEGSSNNKALEIYNGTGCAGRPRGRRLRRADVRQRRPTATLDDPLTGHGGQRRRVRRWPRPRPAPRSSRQADQTNGAGSASTATTPWCCARAPRVSRRHRPDRRRPRHRVGQRARPAPPTTPCAARPPSAPVTPTAPTPSTRRSSGTASRPTPSTASAPTRGKPGRRRPDGHLGDARGPAARPRPR